MVTYGMVKNRATLDGPALQERLREKGLTPYGFAMKHHLDYSHFWRCFRQGKHASASVLTALAAEGVDVRDLLVPLAESEAAAPDTHAS